MTELYWGFLRREILRDGFTSFKKDPWRNSLVVQWFGCCVFIVEGMGLIPGWGIKILKAESNHNPGPPPPKPNNNKKPEQKGPKECCFSFFVSGHCWGKLWHLDQGEHLGTSPRAKAKVEDCRVKKIQSLGSQWPKTKLINPGSILLFLVVKWPFCLFTFNWIKKLAHKKYYIVVSAYSLFWSYNIYACSLGGPPIDFIKMFF